MGPVTTLLQAEQIGMGSDPSTSLSQTEPEEDVESKPALHLLSEEEQWKMPLRQVPWNKLGGFGVGVTTGQRSEGVKGNQQGKSDYLVCHQTWHCLQALTLQPIHHRLVRPWR